MPTNAEPDTDPDADVVWAVDTSVAIAYLDAGHSAHDACVAVVGDRRPALAGHAAYESFSVLTRLPGPAQVRAADAATALAAAFPGSCWLTPDEHDALRERLAVVGVRGGAVYDALVGEAARLRERVLLTRDRRARRTYDLIGTSVEFVD